eukprot:355782-Chlamydomonas_euryale.AAC.4
METSPSCCSWGRHRMERSWRPCSATQRQRRASRPQSSAWWCSSWVRGCCPRRRWRCGRRWALRDECRAASAKCDALQSVKDRNCDSGGAVAQGAPLCPSAAWCSSGKASLASPSALPETG